MVAAPAATTQARDPVPTAPPAPAAPTDAAPSPAAAQPAAEAPAATRAAGDTVTTTERGTPIWPFILGALVVLGGLVAFLLRRRRVADAAYDEEVDPVYVAPSADPAPIVARPEPAPATIRDEPAIRPAIAPIAAAPVADAVLHEEPPVATEDATLVEPEAEDVEALTATEPPVADRPWLEFSLRPVRAGSNVDEALVEIELTVGNSGNIAAEDVRISTFLFADGSVSEAEMERVLTERGDDGVDPVTIAPGEGTRVDATLALLKRDLAGEEFSPVVLADARYRLLDGSEGRTSATFLIGLAEEGGTAFTPISIARPLMHEEVEARLQGAPGHA